MIRVALYARVSSEQQEQRGTVASQLAAVRAYAQAHQFAVCEEYVCVDEGYSGARLDRPGLDRLRDGAALRAFDAVVVLCPDRLARRYAYQVLIVEELSRWDIPVHFCENPPPTDPQAQLLVQIQGIMAEYERAKIAERYRRGKLFRLRQGEALFWRVPYGYRRTPRQGALPATIEIAEPAASWVRTIFRWHVEERLSARRIARRLTQQQLPSPTGKWRWGPGTVNRILHNEAYIGSLAYNRRDTTLPPVARGWGKQPRTRTRVRPREEWIRLAVPPLIDPALFARSQSIHGDNSRFSPRRLREEHWLLRGLIRCGCGRAMACQRMQGANGTVHYYYACQRADPLKDDYLCTQRRARATELDAFVWATVRRHLEDPATLTRAYQQAGSDGGQLDESALGARLRQVTRRQQELLHEAARLLDAYQAGLVDLAAFARRQATVEDHRHRLEQERRSLEAQRATAGYEQTIQHSLAAFAQHIQTRLAGLTFAERQELVRLVIDHVVIRDHHVTIYFKIPVDLAPPMPSPKPKRPSAPPVSTRFALRSTDDDVAVGMELRLFPGDREPRRGRQGQQRGAFDGLEEDEGLLLDGAVDPAPGGLEAPAECVAVGGVDVAERPAGQAVAGDIVHAALLDLPFMFGRARPARRDQEAIMLRALSVHLLHLGIVPDRVHDGRLEIIDHEATRHPVEPLKGRPVTPAPGGDGLVEDELDVLVAAVGQRHHEGPGLAAAARVGIEEQSGGAEVDLGLVPRGGLDPHGRARRGGFQSTQKALHGRVTAGEPVLLDQELEDGLALHALLAPGHDLVLVRRHRGLLVGRPLPLGRAEQGRHGRGVRQRAAEEALPLGPAAITGHGVPAQAQLPGNAPVRLAQLEPAEHFTHVGHLAPLSRHRSPLRVAG